MNPRSASRHEVRTPDGFRLRGRLSGEGTAAVLFVHGYVGEAGGQKSQAIEAECTRRGWPFAAFDFRGHGRSDGTLCDLRCAALQVDLDAVAAFLAERGVRRLFVVGSSMGGFATAWFAARRPETVPACVLLAPAFRFPTRIFAWLSEEERERWHLTRRLPVRNLARESDEELDYALIEEADGFPADELATNWRTPALILHSMQDDVVPYQGSVEFVARTPSQELELRLYRDGDHRDPTSHDRLTAAVADFFARHGMDV